MPLIRGKQITALEITARELGPLAVETAKIDDLAVTNPKIALLAVDTAQLALGSVTEGKLDSTLELSLIRTDGSQAWTADQSVGGNKFTNLADPTSAQDAATKAYVDALSAGLDPKESCRLATAAALAAVTPAGTGVGKTLTADANGALSVDGVLVANNDRVLVKDQASAPDNGIYDVTDLGSAGTPFVLTRAVDADQDAEVTAGMFTFVEEGTVNADAGFVLTTNNPIVVDTNDQDFTQFSGAGQIVAGAGLTKNGNTLDVNVGTGIEIVSDAVRIATQGTGIAGGGGTTLTFDAAAADGNGLTGSGAVLTVDSDTETGGNIQGVNVTANGVGLDVAAIAGTGLEADGAANLRIAASAAGAGLIGGGGSALAVGAGNAITVNANDVAVNPAGLIQGGAAEVDGDKLDIDFSPTNYTEETGTVGGVAATLVDHLTSHLGGIDTKLGTLSTGGGAPQQEAVTTENITGTDTALGDTLNNTPVSNASVTIYLNGVLQEQGASKDYTISGTTLTWLASSGTAVDMDTADVLTAVYEA